MRLVILSLNLSVLLFTCGQAKNSDKDVQYSDNSNDKKEFLSGWLNKTIGFDKIISDSIFSKASFNSSNYELPASAEFVDKMQFKKNGQTPIIKTDNKLINLEYDSEDNYENYFAKEDFFVYSHHAKAGTNGGSTIYNLKTKKVSEYRYTINSIKDYLAEIGKDGYDKEGHFWQSGVINLQTGEIFWGKVEH